MTYEPNPPPDQVEAFQPFGGKPLALLKVGAGLLARKGQAEPIIEPSPNKRAELETRITRDVLAAEAVATRENETQDGEMLPAASASEGSEDWGGELSRDSTPPTSGVNAEDVDQSRHATKETGTMRTAKSGSVAGIGIDLTPPEMLRLNVATMRLGLSAQEILSAALDLYLDAEKVPSIEACALLLADPIR